MATQIAAANLTVFPTANDIGPTEGDGRIATEANMENFVQYLVGDSFVISGFDVTQDSGADYDIASGTAWIGGHYVSVSATTSHTLPLNTTRWIFLQLTRDGDSRVDGAQITDQAVGTTPSDSVILREVQLNAVGTELSNTEERRWKPGTNVGTYLGDDSTNRILDIGWTPSCVMCAGTDANSKIFGVSTILTAGYKAVTTTTGSLNCAGFFVKEVADTTTTEVLQGSTTWNTGNLTADTVYTTTVTVTGAATGDMAVAEHDDQSGTGDFVSIRAKVTSSNTVTVWAWTTYSSPLQNLSGTVRAAVFKSGNLTIPQRQAEFTNATTGYYAPYILEDGFRVGRDASGSHHLNRNGTRYNYIAIG